MRLLAEGELCVEAIVRAISKTGYEIRQARPRRLPEITFVTAIFPDVTRRGICLLAMALPDKFHLICNSLPRLTAIGEFSLMNRYATV